MAKRCTVEWFRLLCDLKRFDFSHNDIFRITSIPIGTLAGYKQGAEPRHADGKKLIKLLCAVTGGSRDDLPKIKKAIGGAIIYKQLTKWRNDSTL